jgi:hypothetical protein
MLKFIALTTALCTIALLVVMSTIGLEAQDGLRLS